MLLPNAQEAEQPSAEAERGPRPLVVVKLGAEGARLRRDLRVAAPRVDPVDATGAGDSFDAGFIAARLAGEDLAGGARARLRVRRAEHAGGRRHGRAADARRGAYLPRVIAFVAASPSIDRLHIVEALRPGEIHRPERVVAVPGGKALNAARAAHALGADVHAIALLGGHTGRWVADALEEEGVTCDAVAGPGRDADVRVGQRRRRPDRVLRARPGARAPSTGRRSRRRPRRWPPARAGSASPARSRPAPRPTAPPASCASPARPAPASRSTSAARRSASAWRPAPTS